MAYLPFLSETTATAIVDDLKSHLDASPGPPTNACDWINAVADAIGCNESSPPHPELCQELDDLRDEYNCNSA